MNINIVAATGVFDVFHVGHLRLLKFAKGQGDFLVVGINSDRVIKILKGDNRPINNEDYRRELLLSIKYVDKVCIVDDTDMVKFLKLHKPTIFIKGAQNNILNNQTEGFKKELEALNEWNGKIIYAPMTDKISSTHILSKI